MQIQDLPWQKFAEDSLSVFKHREGLKQLAILDHDGQILFRQGALPDDQIVTLAALTAGIHSAGQALEQFLHQGLSDEQLLWPEAQIAQDTPWGGVALYPLHSRALLIAVYGRIDQVGRLKMELRLFRDKINETLKKQDLGAKSSTVPGAKMANRVKTNQKMFENITDDEIDSLFGGS
jgi:predicted regulator of Ras-like GTPase activity (Roadblock/LC7/MglB family)